MERTSSTERASGKRRQAAQAASAGLNLRAPMAQRLVPAARSPGHANDPAVEADLTVETRPGEVSGVPSARITDVDTVAVVPDADKPVAFSEPSVATHEQGSLIEPGLQIADGGQWPESASRVSRLARL